MRRDVYIRYAVFVHMLQKHQNINLNKFKLVLPPWSRLYHWKRKDEPEHIAWSKFFDLHSLKLFVPVVEMYEYFQSKLRKTVLIVLQFTYYFFNRCETKKWFGCHRRSLCPPTF